MEAIRSKLTRSRSDKGCLKVLKLWAGAAAVELIQIHSWEMVWPLGLLLIPWIYANNLL